MVWLPLRGVDSLVTWDRDAGVMAERIDRLIRAEAEFRANVIVVLGSEVQRLRQHRVIVTEQGGSQERLAHLIEVLEQMACKLAAQDGHMACALRRCAHHHGADDLAQLEPARSG